MKQEKLKPCPNPACGSEDTIVISDINGWVYWAVCRMCGMTGPNAPTEAEARKAWDGLPRHAPLYRFVVGVDALPQECGFYHLYINGVFSDVIEFDPSPTQPWNFWQHGSECEFDLNTGDIIIGPIDIPEEVPK